MNKKNEPHGLASLYEENPIRGQTEVWYIAKCLCGLPVYGRTRKEARSEIRWHVRWMDMDKTERNVENHQATYENEPPNL